MVSDTTRIDTRIRRALATVRTAFRAVLTALDAAPGVQLAGANALSGETLQASELAQHFGFTSHPPAGTQCIVLPLGGKSAHSVVVATEHGSYRIAGLKSGEVAVYNQSGAKIVLKDQRIIEIDCDELKIAAKNSMSVTTKALSMKGSDSISLDTAAHTVKAKTSDTTATAYLGLHSPDLDLGGDGEDGAARMRGNVWITGWSRADLDHITGDISLVGHRHVGCQGGDTGKPKS